MVQHVGQELQFLKMEGIKEFFLEKFFLFYLIRSSVQSHYDKPLSLKLQWILKEMRQKSQMIGTMRRTTSGLFN
jgi:hypothetical protein